MSPDFGAALWPADVFADGVRKEDVQAALQAAWLAGDISLCAEIAARYGVFGRVCLRCATGGTPAVEKRPNTLLFHLCEMCSEQEQRKPRALVTLALARADLAAVRDPVAAIREAQEVINAAHPDKPALAVDGYLGPRTMARLWGKP